MITNIKMPDDNPIISIGVGVNGILPDTPGKCTERQLYVNEETNTCLAKTLTYERSGMFYRAVLVDYEYFLVNGIFRLGYLMDGMMSIFHPKKSVRIKSRYLAIIWTDQLKEIDAVYKLRRADIKVCDNKRQALDEYRKITSLLKWLKTEKTYLLKNGSSKELTPIFSEYVNTAAYPLSILQSNFLSHVKK